MALVPWHKDKDTKEWYYYDTDDLNDEEYARVSPYGGRRALAQRTFSQSDVA